MARVLIGLCLIVLAGCGAGGVTVAPTPVPTALAPTAIATPTEVVTAPTVAPTPASTIGAAIAALPPDESRAAHTTEVALESGFTLLQMTGAVHDGTLTKTDLFAKFDAATPAFDTLSQDLYLDTTRPKGVAMGCATGLAFAYLGAARTAAAHTIADPTTLPAEYGWGVSIGQSAASALQAWAFRRPVPNVPPATWALIMEPSLGVPTKPLPPACPHA